MKWLVPLLGCFALTACGPSLAEVTGAAPERQPPEPRIVTPASPDLAKLSGRWVGRAETATEIYWSSGFSGHAPPLRVDVETINTDAMLTLIVIGDYWTRVLLHAKPSPQQDIYEGQVQAAPSLYWFRVRLVRDGVLGFEMERNTPQPAGVLIRTQLHRP